VFANTLCYTEAMEKTILIAGKDMPAGSGFAAAFAEAGYDVTITEPEQGARTVPTEKNITAAAWNRPSSVSARSLVLQAENAYGPVGATVLYFDGPAYAAQFAVLSPHDCSAALDAMIAGYQYLAIETMNRLDQRNESGRLVFLLKRCPTMEETLRSPSARGGVTVSAGPFVAAAQASFTAFAENVAASAGDKQNLTVVLVLCDSQNETAENDGTLASWLAGYLASLDGLKSKPGAKQAVNWIKAGAKGPGFLSLFR
jgi:hypothetical protein